MSFGKRLRMLRAEKKITQKELGEIIKVSERVIGYYEADNRFPKDELTILRLSEYFNVSTDYLLGKSNIRNPYKETPEQKTDEDIDLWLSKTDGYKELPEEDRELISNLAKNLLEKHRKEK